MCTIIIGMVHILPIVLLFSVLSCSKVPEAVPAVAETAAAETPPAEYGQFALALLQSGENPLWFEVGENGPVLISSPEEAFLNPFVPWPLSIRVAGILISEDRIILGVNREGFLAFVPWTGTEGAGIALYRVDNSPYWKNYSVESLFFFGGTPAAMIYRNDYFIDTGLPPPSPRVWGLKTGAGIEEMDIPAFADLPPEDGWDLEDLQEGPDGWWYYRAIRKGKTGKGMGYFRTTDLSLQGEPSSQGALQNAAQPRPPEQAPALLRQTLEAALSLGGTDEAGIAGIVAPEFPSLRYYALSPVMNTVQDDLLIYPGYYHGGGGETGETALVVNPAGQGVIGIEKEGVFTIREFILPPLPQDFVYTGVVLFARSVLGTWEEQDGWNVGAAGFVLAGVDVLY
jgi:hypothetical protein